MPVKNLKIDDLLLDLINPRTQEVESQREAMQAVINNQKSLLASLADDIAEHGLNPADRLLVMYQKSPKGYVALEGNRRVAALKILNNPQVLNGLNIPRGLQVRLEAAAKKFDPSKVEPVPCFSFSKREDAHKWIENRHTGQGAGEGIVQWSGVAAARFRGSSPSLQAIDLVKRFGKLSDEDRASLDNDFSISVLDRVMGSKIMKEAFGLKTTKNVLFATVAADEVVKILNHLVTEIAGGRLTNRTLNKKEDQENFVRSLPNSVLPDLKKVIVETPIDAFGQSDFSAKSQTATRPKRKNKSAVQKGIWPKNFTLEIGVERIKDIFIEIKGLEIEKNKNAISILMRIILEMSADEYMDRSSLDRKKGSPHHTREKTLAEKVSECCQHLIANGVKKHLLSPVTKSINNSNSPLYHDLLNQYVHNAHHNPSPGELQAGATPLRTFLEHVWSQS